MHVVTKPTFPIPNSFKCMQHWWWGSGLVSLLQESRKLPVKRTEWHEKQVKLKREKCSKHHLCTSTNVDKKTANVHQQMSTKKEKKTIGLVSSTLENGWMRNGTSSELWKTAGQCPHECALPTRSSGRPPWRYPSWWVGRGKQAWRHSCSQQHSYQPVGRVQMGVSQGLDCWECNCECGEKEWK